VDADPSVKRDLGIHVVREATVAEAASVVSIERV
jgi:hypothetical protein